jgi:hypothetical protein
MAATEAARQEPVDGAGPPCVDCVKVSANRVLRLVSAPLRASSYPCLHNPTAVLRNAASSLAFRKKSPATSAGLEVIGNYFP